MGKPEALSQAQNQENDNSHRSTALEPSSEVVGADRKEQTISSNACSMVTDSSELPAAFADDTKEILSKLQASLQENLSQSRATSVAERLLEMNNHDPSPEATARRAPKEFDPIVEGIGQHDILPGAPWGFVVFRTVYGPDSDAPFIRMLGLLREMEETLSYYGQQYLMKHHELTVIEDEKTLSGADSHTVRDAFRAWVADDLTPRLKDTERWGGQAEVRKILRSDIPVGDPHWNAERHHPATCMPTRWQFCLFVDENCLRSLNESADPPGPHVKILNTDWKGDRSVNIAEGWEDGETDEEMEDVIIQVFRPEPVSRLFE